MDPKRIGAQKGPTLWVWSESWRPPALPAALASAGRTPYALERSVWAAAATFACASHEAAFPTPQPHDHRPPHRLGLLLHPVQLALWMALRACSRPPASGFASTAWSSCTSRGATPLTPVRAHYIPPAISRTRRSRRARSTRRASSFLRGAPNVSTFLCCVSCRRYPSPELSTEERHARVLHAPAPTPQGQNHRQRRHRRLLRPRRLRRRVRRVKQTSRPLQPALGREGFAASFIKPSGPRKGPLYTTTALPGEWQPHSGSA